MGNLIKPSDVRVIAKDGEIHVHLTLDLNLNLTGCTPSTTAPVASNVAVIQSAEPEKEKQNWSIPDFGLGSLTGKLKFGKSTDEETQE